VTLGLDRVGEVIPLRQRRSACKQLTTNTLDLLTVEPLRYSPAPGIHGNSVAHSRIPWNEKNMSGNGILIPNLI